MSGPDFLISGVIFPPFLKTIKKNIKMKLGWMSCGVVVGVGWGGGDIKYGPFLDPCFPD